MMNVHRCTKLISSVFKSRVLLEPTGFFRSVCSALKEPCHGHHSPCLSRFTANVSSCQIWRHVHSSHSGSKRFYSEVCGESSDSKRSAGVFQEESHEMETDSSQSK